MDQATATEMNQGLSYFRRKGDEPLLEQTIPERLKQIAQSYADHPAVVSRPQQRRLNYAQLEDETDRLACGLLALGFGKGSRIGIWSTNNIEWLLLQLATARIGAILVNINPAYQTDELAYALRCSEVEGLFTIPRFHHSDYLDVLEALIPELRNGDPQLRPQAFPKLRHIIVFDPYAIQQIASPAPAYLSWQQIIAGGEHISDAQLEEVTTTLSCFEPINIQYTSGTTGFPKAVVLTHHNILNNAYFSAQAMHFSDRDRLCTPVPFYHCFGMVLANLLCISVGACNVIACDHFDPLEVLAAIEAEHCTALHGVPTMFISELEHPDFKHFDLSSLRTGIMAGAPCPPTLMARVMERMHCREILIGYGETEASPLSHLTDINDTLIRRTQTVGRNLPHQEVKIVDLDDGHTLPLKQSGEICFRGYHVMQGYYHDEIATAKAIDADGWLHSGDIGSMDEEGYVRITGRLKDMIIRGGENIYPAEIEAVLFNHPKIADAAVFGMPDEYYGEEIMAWVQTHADEQLSEQEIRDYCKEKLAHFKVPKYVWLVNEFPMTVTGKLQKFKMREIAMREMGK